MAEDDVTPYTKIAPIPLRVPEPTIEWPCADDLLGRGEEIENLSPVLLNVQAPLVFAIDAPWGGGKTTFIKLWMQYLQSEKKVGLYLNCWENDFFDDPLLPMLSVLDSWISKSASDHEFKKAWKRVKKLAPVIVKSLATTALKKAGINIAQLRIDIVAGSLVDSFNAKKQALTEFKEQIKTVMGALPEGQQNLIIFIDELDRCRPTYAIEVLERIKHLFDIKRVVFVLAINRKQLAKSLQGVYGPSFDGNHYLKRFIDLDYQLQVPDQSAYISARLNQQDLIDYFSKREGSVAFDNMRWPIKGMIQHFDYQLRDIDQLVMRLRLVVKSIPAHYYIDIEVLSALLILREQNQELYEQYKADASCVNDVITCLLGDPKTDALPGYFAGVGGQLILASIDPNQSEEKSKMIKYWKDLAEAPELEQDNRDKIEELLRDVYAGVKGTNGSTSRRKLAFERIELIRKIKINAE